MKAIVRVEDDKTCTVAVDGHCMLRVDENCITGLSPEQATQAKKLLMLFFNAGRNQAREDIVRAIRSLE